MHSFDRFHPPHPRNWLVLAIGVLMSGCLDKAPSYDGQKRLPPYVVTALVLPDLGMVNDVEDGMMTVEVPFRSEDLDQPVRAAFFVDGEFYNDLDYRASVFEDDTRRVEETIRLDEGCHLVQLVLAHADNLPRPSTNPLNVALASYLYWWVVVPPEEGEVRCPR